MQEETDFRVRQLIAQHLGQQHELIVMHPDEVVRAGFLQNRVTEPLVGFDVGGPGIVEFVSWRVLKPCFEKLVAVATFGDALIGGRLQNRGALSVLEKGVVVPLSLKLALLGTQGFRLPLSHLRPHRRSGVSYPTMRVSTCRGPRG